MSKYVALSWSDSTAYFFKGGECFQYNIEADRVDAGYPKPIASMWPGVFERDIDAAVMWNNGKIYFFKGSDYIRYDIAADRADVGYPKPISSEWPGLFDRDIDGAIVWPSGNAYFFRGGQYLRYDPEADQADDPEPISSAWPGAFDRDIDTAVVWPTNKVYFFKGDQYIRYDIDTDQGDPGYPRPITSGWSTLQPTSTTPSGPTAPAGCYIATLFAFQLRANEPVGPRIVRCCEEALRDGAMGKQERHDFYRDFIACNREKTKQKADLLTGVHTSCAMFVRAVRQWCGAPLIGPYVPGTGMFKSMGDVNFNHPAFVTNNGSNKPNPGDYFYISSSKQALDGHTGIFIEETSTGVWRTAEGGGGSDGTLCRFTQRTMAGNKFSNDKRTLWGWFDCTRVGLPS